MTETSQTIRRGAQLLRSFGNDLATRIEQLGAELDEEREEIEWQLNRCENKLEAERRRLQAPAAELTRAAQRLLGQVRSSVARVAR